MIAGGMDQQVKVLSIKKNQLNPLYALEGATSTIESLDCNPLDPRFVCAGSFDHKLIFWMFPLGSNDKGEDKV